jgi:hypothetical protein
MRTTSRGFTVFDLSTDQYDHTKVASNWDLADSLLGQSANSVQTLPTLPTSGLFPGELVMLSAANSSFPAWTLLRYDGTSWHTVGYEIQPTVPVSNLYPGRLVLLSAASGAFTAWSLIRYDGTQWDIIGGFQTVSTGTNPNNISGLSFSGDVYLSNSVRGLVIKDRVSGTNYRIYISNGDVGMEIVT